MPNTLCSAELERNIRQLKTLMEEHKYPEACRLCYYGIKTWPSDNNFYRCKAYCELQLSRWHPCLETVGWLNGYKEHPAFCKNYGKLRHRKRRRQEYADLEVSEDQANQLATAVNTHFQGNECLWLHFEQSYCYYKLGKYELGLKALEMCANDNRICHDLLKSNESITKVGEFNISKMAPKCQLLYAQICMRMSMFDETKLIYSVLKIDSGHSLLNINRLSVDLALASNVQTNQPQICDLYDELNTQIESGKVDSYELYYNWTCAKIIDCCYGDALQYLDLAEEMLRDELSQEVGEDVLSNQPEIANILSLRGFLQIMLGNNELAMCIHKQFVELFANNSEVDQSVLLVTLSNLLAVVNHEINIDDIHKALSKLLKRDIVTAKFSVNDLRNIHNNCVWSFLSNQKFVECKRHLLSFKDIFMKHFGDQGSIDYVIYEAALKMFEGNIKGCLSTLFRAKQHFGSSNYRILRTIINLLINLKRFQEASNLLKYSFSAFDHSPKGVLKYFEQSFSVYIGTKCINALVSSLCQLIELHKSNKYDFDCNKFKCLVIFGCEFLELNGLHKEALGFYHYLYLLFTNDKHVMCGVLYNSSFVKSGCDNNFDVPKELTDEISRQLRYIDPEELEVNSKVPLYYTEMDNVEATISSTKCGKKRKRKGKLPKVVHLGAPDPERWLPKYERLAYKKKKKKEGSSARTTQGSTGSAGPSKPTTGTIVTDSVTNTNRRRAKKRVNR